LPEKEVSGDGWARRSLRNISHLRYCRFVQLLLHFDQSLPISFTLLALRQQAFLGLPMTSDTTDQQSASIPVHADRKLTHL